MSVDIWLKDNSPDLGVEPGTAGLVLSASPDIIARNVAVANFNGLPSGIDLKADVPVADPVRQGQDNYVYVRARNRGMAVGDDAQGVVAHLFYSESGTLANPSVGWQRIGPVAGTPLPGTLSSGAGEPGHDPLITEVQWAQAALPPVAHYCFIALLTNPQDSTETDPNSIGFTDFQDWVRSHNNVAWRNFEVLVPLPDPPPPPPPGGGSGGGGPGPNERFNFYRFIAGAPGAPGDELMMQLQLLAELPPKTVIEVEGPRDFLRKLAEPGDVAKLDDRLDKALTFKPKIKQEPAPVIHDTRVFPARLDLRDRESLTSRFLPYGRRPEEIDTRVTLRSARGSLTFNSLRIPRKSWNRLAFNIWIPERAMRRDFFVSLLQRAHGKVIGSITRKLLRPGR